MQDGNLRKNSILTKGEIQWVKNLPMIKTTLGKPLGKLCSLAEGKFWENVVKKAQG